MVSSKAEGDKDSFDDLVLKIADVAIYKKYDLKHLSPLTVVDKDWPKLLTSPISKVNRNFQDTGIAEKAKRNIFSKYYQSNRNNHFVWTNQNVIKRGTEIHDHLEEELSLMGNFNYENCNLKNPDKSFELRPTDKFGFGLYAKHNIPKGAFSLIFIS